MTIAISFFVVDPDRGPIDEANFQDGDLAALLDPESPAGIEIEATTGDVIIRDTLDGVIAGVCLGGGAALTTGDSFSFVSFSGYDPAVISLEGDTAVFECDGDEVRAPAADSLTALRGLAGRYAALLEKAFPQDVERRAQLAEFAAG
ncbi:MAG: hypothetical protein COC12_12965 [Rhodobacteraceae bacterium]|nr:MAG: hypothetical protein COC12_12965 [Paracoccaceae bacterium]